MTWYPNRPRTVVRGSWPSSARPSRAIGRAWASLGLTEVDRTGAPRRPEGLRPVRNGAAHSAVTGGLPKDRAQTTSNDPRRSGPALPPLRPGLGSPSTRSAQPSCAPRSPGTPSDARRRPGARPAGRASTGPGPARGDRHRSPGPAIDGPGGLGSSSGSVGELLEGDGRSPGHGRPARRGPWRPGGPGTGRPPRTSQQGGGPPRRGGRPRHRSARRSGKRGSRAIPGSSRQAPSATSAAGLVGRDHDVAAGLLALGAGRHAADLVDGVVDDLAVSGGHRLEGPVRSRRR